MQCILSETNEKQWKKITCQPTTSARRGRNAPKCVALLGKRRLLFSIAKRLAKRKRNLGLNIKDNCANAKSH